MHLPLFARFLAPLAPLASRTDPEPFTPGPPHPPSFPHQPNKPTGLITTYNTSTASTCPTSSDLQPSYPLTLSPCTPLPPFRVFDFSLLVTDSSAYTIIAYTHKDCRRSNSDMGVVLFPGDGKISCISGPARRDRDFVAVELIQLVIIE